MLSCVMRYIDSHRWSFACRVQLCHLENVPLRDEGTLQRRGALVQWTTVGRGNHRNQLAPLCR